MLAAYTSTPEPNSCNQFLPNLAIADIEAVCNSKNAMRILWFASRKLYFNINVFFSCYQHKLQHRFSDAWIVESKCFGYPPNHAVTMCLGWTISAVCF